jgi:predicted ATPase
MKAIALVGVSGSGKSTLANALHEKSGGKIQVMEELPRPDICKFANIPVTYEPSKASAGESLKYDLARYDMQIELEKRMMSSDDGDGFIVIDKSLPNLFMYLLTVDARQMQHSVKHIDRMVDEFKQHASLYHTIVYRPFGFGWQLKDQSLERNFTSKYLLEMQDVCLERIIDWVDEHTVEDINLCVTDSDLDVNVTRIIEDYLNMEIANVR